LIKPLNGFPAVASIIRSGINGNMD